jgi:AraC-like DNA-binding protein
VFSADHLSLKLLRLRADEEWTSPGIGFSFLFPRSGAGKYLVGPLTHRLNAGDVLVVNGDPKGRVGVKGGGELSLWLFSVEFGHLYPLFASRELALLPGIAEKLKRARFFGASTAEAQECHQLLAQAPPRLDFEHRTHLLRVAATLLSGEIKAAQAIRERQGGPDERVAEVLDRLSAGDLLNLSVEDLAQKFGFCRRHLNRLFHQYFGLSVGRLRMEMRMLKALTLLRDPNAKVINVAEECGFNHLGLFNASFRHRFGTSPGQWRNQGREVEPGLADSSLGHQLCALRTAGFCPLGSGQVAAAAECSGVTTNGNGGGNDGPEPQQKSSRPERETLHQERTDLPLCDV